MKKIIAICFALCMLFSLAGCGKSAPVSSSAPISSAPPAASSGINPDDGIPFEGGSFSEMVGSYTVNTQWLPLEKSLVVEDIFDVCVAVWKDTYYVLTDEVIHQYTLSGGSLVFEKDLPLEEGYEYIYVGNDGTLFASGFMMDFIGYKDGEQLFAHDGLDNVTMHPSGEWGISWFGGPEMEKVTINGDTLQIEKMVFAELDSVSTVSVSQAHIFVTGRSVKNDEQAIFVYDLAGRLQHTLADTPFGEEDSLGFVSVVTETANGFMALDANMRNLCFWQADGTFIGTLDDGGLFGTQYPWMNTATLLPDGSIVVGMTEERADESADEFILYTLTGF